MPATLNQRQTVAVDPALTGRVMLRRLLAENAALLREVAELRALRDLANQDGLTGLRNRRYLEARVQEELGRSQRAARRRGALLVIEVVGLEVINGRHGRVVGDRALRWFARLLLDTTRAQDVCCRTGTNEFMVVLPASERAAAESVAADLQARLRSARGFRWLPLAVRVGIGTWPEQGPTVADVLDAAVRALRDPPCGQRQPPRLQLVR
jgi:diguanylate cyclase (GGDEF)-like protein